MFIHLISVIAHPDYYTFKTGYDVDTTSNPYTVETGTTYDLSIEGPTEWQACQDHPSALVPIVDIKRNFLPRDLFSSESDMEEEVQYYSRKEQSMYKNLYYYMDKSYYKWRADNQVEDMCINNAVKYVKLFNEMPDIHLHSKRDGIRRPRRFNLVLDVDETLFHRPHNESLVMHLSERELKCKWMSFTNPHGKVEVICQRIRPGVDMLLQSLHKKVHLYVWTMSNRDRTERVLTMFGIRHYFHDLITHEYLTKEPNLPDIHVKALQKTFTSPDFGFHNTLHIDDRTGPFLLNQLNGLRIRMFGGEDDLQIFTYKSLMDWILRCYDATGDVQRCVAQIKTAYPGTFDGFKPNENSIDSKHYVVE